MGYLEAINLVFFKYTFPVKYFRAIFVNLINFSEIQPLNTAQKSRSTQWNTSPFFFPWLQVTTIVNNFHLFLPLDVVQAGLTTDWYVVARDDVELRFPLFLPSRLGIVGTTTPSSFVLFKDVLCDAMHKCTLMDEHTMGACSTCMYHTLPFLYVWIPFLSHYIKCPLWTYL